MWYVRDVLYAVLYVRVSCFVVCGCGVSRRYIDICFCDMFSVVNVYLSLIVIVSIQKDLSRSSLSISSRITIIHPLTIENQHIFLY